MLSFAANFTLKPFKVSLLKQILSELKPNYTPEDLLALWTVTGGVARYVNMMIGAKALTRKQIVNAIARNATPVKWAFRGACPSNVPHSWFCFLHSRMVQPKRRLKSVFR